MKNIEIKIREVQIVEDNKTQEFEIIDKDYPIKHQFTVCTSSIEKNGNNPLEYIIALSIAPYKDYIENIQR